MSDATAAPDLEEVEEEPAEAEALPADEAPQEAEAEAPLDAGSSEEAEQDSATPEEPVPAESPEAETQPEIEERPFVLRADHQEIALPGAVERGDEIVIPRAQLQSLQRHLVGDRRQLIQQAQQAGRQQAEQNLDKHPAVIRAQTLTAKLDELFSDRDKLVEFYNNFDQNREILQRDLKIRELEAHQNQARERDTVQQREQYRAQMEPVIRQSINDYVDSLVKEPQYAGLDPEVLKERAWLARASLVTVADDDYPDAGLRRGDPAVRLDVLRGLFEADRKLVERLKPKVNPKATAAAKQNAGALGAPKKVPATVAAKGSPAPAVDQGFTGKTKEEFDEYMRKKHGVEWG